jgi:cob(I)alamin adenosyltransferase
MKDVTKTRTLSGIFEKDSDVVWAIGSIDESNALIGLAKVFAGSKRVKKILEEIQLKMFEAGSEFALGNKFSEENYRWILEVIQKLERDVKKPESFIVLEQNESTAFLSVARAFVRRSERWAVRLYKKGEISETLVRWLNKLSYLLYLLILLENSNYRLVE